MHKASVAFLQSLMRDERGVVMTEYIVLVVFVTLGGAAAVVSLGVPLYQYYRYVQLVISLPIP